MNNEYTVVAGCSMTFGSGFELEDKSPYLWVNLLHKEYLNSTILINDSIGGASNSGIFKMLSPT
jgi:hypothetical protein